MRNFPLPVLLLLVAAYALVPMTGGARGVDFSAAPASTRLIILGTKSGPVPVMGRAQSADILIVNGTYYLIDAGDGVVRRLTRAGILTRKIGTIFITHAHSDHTGGLPSLLQTEFDENRKEPIDIYGPPGIDILVSAIKPYLAANSDIRISDGTRVVRSENLLNAHVLGTGTVYRDANLTVKAVENTHFHFAPGSPAYGKYKSYSYRFETKDRVIVLTGDTGPSDAVTALAKRADLLVSEVLDPEEARAMRVKNGEWAGMTPKQRLGFMRHMQEEHLTPGEVGEMAARAGVKAVVLTHILAGPDPKDDYARFAEGVRGKFSGPVTVAKDLMSF